MKFFAVFLLVVLLGLLQSTSLLDVFSVKPDILLALLIAASFFIIDPAQYAFLLLVALVFVNYQSSFQFESLIFSALVIVSAVAGRRLQWLPIFNNVLLTGLSTVLFYAVASPKYLISDWPTVLMELIYNCVLSIIIYKALDSCIGHNKAIFS